MRHETQNHPLLGKVITAVYLGDDGGGIKFDIQGEESIWASCYAMCCSSTRIENVENPEFLIGAAVTAVLNLDMPTAAVQNGLMECVGC